MDSLNPYSAPSTTPTAVGTPPEGDPAYLAWRSGDLLVVTAHSELPARCLKCNAPTLGRPKRFTLKWCPEFMSVMLVMGLLPYFVLLPFCRRTLPLNVSLCSLHHNRQQQLVLLTWLAPLLILLAGGVTSLVVEDEIPERSLMIGLIFAVYFGIACSEFARLFSATRIEKPFAWVKGAGKEFLAELPEYDGPPPKGVALRPSQ